MRNQTKLCFRLSGFEPPLKLADIDGAGGGGGGWRHTIKRRTIGRRDRSEEIQNTKVNQYKTTKAQRTDGSEEMAFHHFLISLTQCVIHNAPHRTDSRICGRWIFLAHGNFISQIRQIYCLDVSIFQSRGANRLWLVSSYWTHICDNWLPLLALLVQLNTVQCTLYTTAVHWVVGSLTKS